MRRRKLRIVSLPAKAESSLPTLRLLFKSKPALRFDIKLYSPYPRRNPAKRLRRGEEVQRSDTQFSRLLR